MKTSESIAALAGALSHAQGEIENALADATNPHFKSKYADLAAIRNAVLGPFVKNGLSIVQFPCTRDGRILLATRLMHKSGEWIEDECELLIEKNTMQGLGSAITYMKRYMLAAISGVAEEDDDGNEATKYPKQSEVKKPAYQSKSDLPKPREVKPITDEQRAALISRLKNELGLDEAKSKEYLRQMTGKQTTKEINSNEFNDLMLDIDDKALGMKNINQMSWSDETLK